MAYTSPAAPAVIETSPAPGGSATIFRPVAPSSAALSQLAMVAALSDRQDSTWLTALRALDFADASLALSCWPRNERKRDRGEDADDQDDDEQLDERKAALVTAHAIEHVGLISLDPVGLGACLAPIQSPRPLGGSPASSLSEARGFASPPRDGFALGHLGRCYGTFISSAVGAVGWTATAETWTVVLVGGRRGRGIGRRCVGAVARLGVVVGDERPGSLTPRAVHRRRRAAEVGDHLARAAARRAGPRGGRCVLRGVVGHGAAGYSGGSGLRCRPCAQRSEPPPPWASRPRASPPRPRPPRGSPARRVAPCSRPATR